MTTLSASNESHDCLFCKITAKNIPAKIEYEDDDLVAIHDVNPQAPFHVLLIPKRHIVRIADVEESDLALIGRMIYRAKKIAEVRNFSEPGYRLVFNSGADGGQTVFHIHLHLLAGRHMTWPPG